VLPPSKIRVKPYSAGFSVKSKEKTLAEKPDATVTKKEETKKTTPNP